MLFFHVVKLMEYLIFPTTMSHDSSFCQVIVNIDRVRIGNGIYFTLIQLVATLHKSLEDTLGFLSLLQSSLVVAC
jgi:hypothetical protein